MKTILILGGYGATGKLLARHLLQQTDTRLVITGRHFEKAHTLAELLNKEYKGGRVEGAFVDAADGATLRKALVGIDLLLNAAPTTAYTEDVIRAALETGVDYLDIQIGEQKLATLRSHAGEIEKAGLCFITEAGFHPGLPAAMVRLAGREFDVLEKALTAGYLNIGPDVVYTEAVDELMEEFKHYRAQVFKDGKWTNPGSWQMRKVNFGGEIGGKQCTSMFFEELGEIPAMFPGLREAGFYIAGSHWFTDWVIYPIALVGLKIAPRRGIRPLGRLVWWGMTKVPRPPYTVILKIEAEGIKEGRQTKIEIIISHPDGYELTAIPVVAMLKQVLDGSARKPGLWMMGHLADPQRLFRDMEQMGVCVEKVYHLQGG
jgi:NAD(P)-dependent dehydrogenase (short-subunit alcohol dehydrogenase family)